MKLKISSVHVENVTSDCGIEDLNIKNQFAVCVKDIRGNIKYALLGDSKAHSLYPGLIKTSDESGRWLFIGGTSKSGAPVPLLPVNVSSPPQFPLAVIAVNTIAENNDIKTVVIATSIRGIFAMGDGLLEAGNMNSYDHTYLKRLASTSNYQAAFDGLSATISKFESAGKRVVLVVDNPALPSPQDCLPRVSSASWINYFLGNKQNKNCVISLEVFKKEIDIYMKLLSNLQAKYPKTVEIYDPTPIYCEEDLGICQALKNGKPLYSYTDHISDYAADLVGQNLNHFLNKN